MDPSMLKDSMHVNGDTQASDWGQEYGPKQFQWNKDAIKPGLDDFDRNIVRDASSPFDKNTVRSNSSGTKTPLSLGWMTLTGTSSAMQAAHLTRIRSEAIPVEQRRH